MKIFDLKKGALIAPLFFIFLSNSYAQKPAERWYAVGYNFSQLGRNEQAFDWMLKSAAAGYAPAQNNIGLSYLHGLGVEANDKKAFEYFEKAAKQGLTYAQSELAMLYYQGKGVEKNLDQAYDWWLGASEGGDEYAQFNLASLLLERGDIKNAFFWFTQAKNNHHPNASEALEQLKERYVE